MYINRNDSVVVFALSCLLWNGCSPARNCSAGRSVLCNEPLLLSVAADKGIESKLQLELLSFLKTEIVMKPLWCPESSVQKET